jgi:hypothetical protein
MFIVNTESEHTVEIIEAGSSEPVIRMENSFRIRVRFAIQGIFSPYLEMVIDLAIKDQGIMFIVHGLCTAGNIEDREAMMMEHEISFGKSPLVIRTPVIQILC